MTLQEIKRIAESPDSTLEEVIATLLEMQRLHAALDAITDKAGLKLGPAVPAYEEMQAAIALASALPENQK